MSSTTRSAGERSRLYRGGWLIVLLALTSYLLVAVAEQGSVGTGLQTVPIEPLPFNRLQGAGIDLSAMSSLEALEWLEATDPTPATLIIVPIDGDIVAAFNDPESFGAARTAMSSLIDATGEARTALCLRRPITALDESVLAEAVMTVIVEEFTDTVTYVSTCPGDPSLAWQTSVLDLIAPDLDIANSGHILAPVSVGAPVRLAPEILPDDLTDSYIDGLSGETYAVITLAEQTSLASDVREKLSQTLHVREHIALVLVVPHPAANPQEFVASLTFPPGTQTEISEGFNNVVSPTMHWEGAWIRTDVGPVSYQRSVDAGSRLTAEFVGTEIWALGLVSPQAGTIGVWIDAEDSEPTGSPDRVVDLARDQARDTSFLLADDLPAARHRITIVTSEGDVAISGIFVTGRPVAGWHGGLASFGIIAVAIGGLFVVISVAVDDLRLRIGLDRDDGEESEHPRVFRRDI